MSELRPTYRKNEHTEQANFVEYVLWAYGQRPDFIRPLFFAVPNGAMLGGRNRFALANKLKAEGLTPGVADILYLQPRGKWHFLAIEMKASGGVATLGQAIFLDACHAVGGMALLCHGSTDAIRAFETYMIVEAT